jgi:DNA-binding transcriptional ArsR family regulator
VLYETPHLTPALQGRLDELDALRDALGHKVSQPLRWMGPLRRSLRASSFESSTSIEGYSVSPEEAIAIIDGGSSADSGDENRQAVACYDRVILDLHFDACHFQPDKSPGLWRTGPIGVTASDGSLEFQGPDADAVPGLMAEVVEWLQEGDPGASPIVWAAMAHLHVTSIHPFRDGNGRVSRIVQSLVLAREGPMSPEFSSIEEYLGENTPAYYAALREVQDGGYRPERDAASWIEFCIDAHIAQARRRLTQVKEAAARWDRLEALVDDRGWPDRLVIALDQSLIGGTDRGRFGEEAEVSAATASADFRRLLDAGLVEQRGKGRSTRYYASERLRAELPS